MFSKSLLKIIIVFSFITGALTGVIPLIPALVSAGFLIIMFFIAPFIIIYLKRLNLIKDMSTEQTLLISAIAGAAAFLGFAVVYFPIACILNLVLKIQDFIWIKVLVTNFVFLIPMVLLMAMLAALLNAFSGFITIYFYQFFSKNNK